MARTPEGAQLTEAHRLIQHRIAAGITRDLLRLWALVDPNGLWTTVDPFSLAGLTLVKTGRRASSAAAQRYYAAFRQIEGVPGAIVITAAPDAPDAIITAALRGAALAGIVKARQRGRSAGEAHQSAFVNVAGNATALVAGGGRQTLMDAIRSDPAAKGYQRVASAGACDFCAELASFGIKSKEKDGASFEAHGHCGCTAEPAYEGS